MQYTILSQHLNNFSAVTKLASWFMLLRTFFQCTEKIEDIYSNHHVRGTPQRPSFTLHSSRHYSRYQVSHDEVGCISTSKTWSRISVMDICWSIAKSDLHCDYSNHFEVLNNGYLLIDSWKWSALYCDCDYQLIILLKSHNFLSLNFTKYFSSKNALKLPYSKVVFEKCSGGVRSDPQGTPRLTRLGRGASIARKEGEGRLRCGSLPFPMMEIVFHAGARNIILQK